MGKAKEIKLKTIPASIANAFVKKHHYSGKVVQNSRLHFGAFLYGELHGVMSYGSPIDKRKVLPLVNTDKNVPCLWNEMLELNRMAFDEYLPKNSESRCIAISFKLLRKHAPHIKWVLSFADGTQCGDGTIYRASGFVLTGIKKNDQLWEPPGGGARFSRLTLTHGIGGDEQKKAKKLLAGRVATNGASSMKAYVDAGWRPLAGFQLRYIYLIDKSCKLTVPKIEFSEIQMRGAGMYKGVRSIVGDAPGNQHGEGGSIPT